ncbi:MAG: TSUP family transporter [Burkholderiales bacterium]|nr:TSUP family transporter [Burkholderiales bacterium]
MEMLVVSLASLLAGFVDSIVGGGGLVLVPALFAVFPTTHPATLFGTNKGASVWGTGIATLQYSRRVTMPWHALGPAAGAGFAASLAGAWLVTVVSPEFLRKLLPAVLVLVLLYTLAKKELGRHHTPRFSGLQETAIALAIGAVIGFYDGFFGPGTGSFFVFFLVRLLGYDFLHASAGAKLLNTATNLAALVLFTLKGHVWWHFALVMGVANVLGSLAGTHLALKHGTGFVRGVFIAVVSALIVKTGYDAYLRPLLS